MVTTLGRQTLAALGAACGQHTAATDGRAAGTEAVAAFPYEFAWLVGALHCTYSVLNKVIR